MRRILVLLTVVALMMVMLVGGAAAYGRPGVAQGCLVREGFQLINNLPDTSPLDRYDRNDDDIICGYFNKQQTHEHFTDNNH
jgi:hypothetical protein